MTLTSDGWLLFATRSIRLFAYGGLSVVLVLYLVSLGLSEADIGLLLSATLIGDTLISLYLTTQADRIGRRRILIIGAALMTAAGLVFGFTAFTSESLRSRFRALAPVLEQISRAELPVRSGRGRKGVKR